MKSIVLILVITATFGNCLERDKRALIQASSRCTSHDQCPTAQACIHNSCGDPCESLCGENTYCTTLNHIPACACKDGYAGNPFIGCTLQATSSCPSTFNSFGKKKKFVLVKTFKLEWLEAFLYCVRNNTRLLTIESMDEFEELRDLTREQGDFIRGYWTSGSDAGSEGNFVWATTGERIPLTSKMWRFNEPENKENAENCLGIVNDNNNYYGLCDYKCTQWTLEFICEYYE